MPFCVQTEGCVLDSPIIAKFRTSMSSAFRYIRETRLKKTNARIRVMTPEATTVWPRPIAFATSPATMHPTGLKPINAIIIRLITRPRLLCSTTICIMVMLPDIVKLLAKPIIATTNSATGRALTEPKKISPRPKIVLPTITHRPNSFSPLRDVKKSAPTTEPAPSKHDSKPKVEAFP